MDLSALPLEDILDNAAAESAQATLWLAGQTLAAARIVSWSRESGILVCRGGHGFTDEDIHYIRAAHLHGLSLRMPAPRTESDRLGADVRESLRNAAGYPVSLVIRPDAFAGAPVQLAAWCASIIEAVGALGAQREPLQAAVDQILLREGNSLAVLGGSTLILEASPAAIPSPDQIRAAIESLL